MRRIYLYDMVTIGKTILNKIYRFLLHCTFYLSMYFVSMYKFLIIENNILQCYLVKKIVQNDTKIFLKSPINRKISTVRLSIVSIWQI